MCLSQLCIGGPAEGAAPHIILPKTSLGPRDVAIVVNEHDPLSAKIAAYYLRRRHIPRENVVRVRFAPNRDVLPRKEFEQMWPKVEAQTPAHVQAYVLTWARPFRVGCMSVTTAFAVGFDERYCAKPSCDPTQASPYFNSDTVTPFADLRLRPTMALAALTFADAKRLIDRGVASDRTHPKGTGYLLRTSDLRRSVRAAAFPEVVKVLGGIVELQFLEADAIHDRDDVLFYFTGAMHVPDLQTNRFLPGAIADHLTSSGGALTSTRQMSALRWLEAGATGSYGTVIEPCSWPQKFPVPGIVIERYLQGESLIEAYWKSVAWPGQGIFIGEPLANPYGGFEVTATEHRLRIRTQALPPGRYVLESSASPVGPYRPVRELSITRLGMHDIDLHDLDAPYYRLDRSP